MSNSSNLHFFQSVSHVRVGVGEVGRDGDRLLVVHQRLVKFALLLEHARQVGMSDRKLRIDLHPRFTHSTNQHVCTTKFTQ